MDEATLKDTNLLELLTPRQLEIMELMANGLSMRQIANTLRIGQTGVEKTTKTIRQRIEAENRQEVIEIWNYYKRRQG